MYTIGFTDISIPFAKVEAGLQEFEERYSEKEMKLSELESILYDVEMKLDAATYLNEPGSILEKIDELKADEGSKLNVTAKRLDSVEERLDTNPTNDAKLSE